MNHKTHTDNREGVKREAGGERGACTKRDGEREGDREAARPARSAACLQFVPETLKMHCAL